LNCVANGIIFREKIFDRLWIQPAAGDAGGALGAALAVWHASRSGQEKRKARSADDMKGALLGPEYSDAEIEVVLRSHQAVFERLSDEVLLTRTIELVQQEKVIGWVQGRMEFGPRALGNRSILGDARSPRMQSVMNLRVKFRESFRPFAPVVRRERVADYFELDVESPYMLLVAPVRKNLCLPVQECSTGRDRIKEVRSTIPAVTHVDYSARVQTITQDQNPRLYALLEKFEQMTGAGVLVNTSFNVRGEPIVCTPDDAYRCFVNTEMDYLIIGNFLLERTAQPHGKVERHFEPVPD
jgi:carbamoyltransferase